MKKSKRFFIIIFLLFVGVLYFAYFVTPGKDYQYESDYLKSYTTDFVEVNDAKIHFLKMGQGEPLVLIHGGGGWLYTFRNNIEELSKYYTIYALDMPGHGYTEFEFGKKLDLDYTADILKEFMDKNKIKKAAILGNSWGGGWALYFSQKHPDRVSKLILVDSSGLVSAEEQDDSAWKWSKYPILGELIVHFITYNGVKEGYAAFNKSNIDETVYKEYYKPLTFKNNLKAQYKYQRDLDWSLTESLFSTMQVDTLIIWGDHDTVIPVELSYELQDKISDSKLVIIKDAGHMPFEEKPVEFNDLVKDFLGD